MENKKIESDLQKSLAHGRSVIGIDIGASSVNVAQAALHQGKLTIIKAVIENIEILGDQERKIATVQALKSALANFDIKNADIVCTLPNQKTILDYVTMPVMPDAELIEAIKIEINNSQFFSIEDPFFDYQIAGRVLDKDVEKINVRVAVIAKSVIDNLLSDFRLLEQDKKPNHVKKSLQGPDFIGFDLVKFIPTSIALENVIKKARSKTQETIVVLEMGSMSSELNIFRDGNLEFSRKINVTGFDFTRALTSALSTNMGKVELTLQEAEWVKKEFGIPSASEEYLIKDKITANQAISLLRPKLEQLIKEITRSFDFYYDKNRAAKLDRLILLGGGTMLKRLPEFFNAELGIPVGLGKSLRDVNCLYEGLLDDLPDSHRVTLCVGAALSDLKGINLLPERFRDTKKKFVKKISMGLMVIGTILASVFFYMLLLSQLNGIQQETLKLETKFQELTPRINSVKDRLLIQNIANHRLDIGGVLRELSYLSDKVYLSNLIFKDGEFILTGFVFAPPREAKKILKSLLMELDNVSLRNAKVSTINAASRDDLKSNFTITASLTAGRGQ